MEALNKNKEEIEKILKEIKENSHWETERERLESAYQERIKTSILWGEDEIEFLENYREINSDILSPITFQSRIKQLQTHLNWLNEQEKKQ